MTLLDLLDRIRHDWQTREPTLDTAPMLTFITLTRAQALLDEHVRATAPDADLTPATRDLLFTLHRSGPPEGLTPGELAALLAVSPASVTGSLDRLETRGLLRRAPDPQDRRAQRIHLTDPGRDLVRTHLPVHLRREEDLLSPLNTAERQQLEHLLRRLIAHAETRQP
ncbi:MarR family winged helix-turn-helix transcriptional regulator [Deinococcus sedimenti]|uniref:MarR family transcriptional regulator n=1 Tax=Deinococcus sedimenti TaxID=1867090 RepID=A0ABQ2S1R2_9DEIO|nr:MarR family transcriptional regulator [Deinococcus sedimenti]GGR88176.1 MarR family transcriptional regulator [Deinococcus sedimenti]